MTTIEQKVELLTELVELLVSTRGAPLTREGGHTYSCAIKNSAYPCNCGADRMEELLRELQSR